MAMIDSRASWNARLGIRLCTECRSLVGEAGRGSTHVAAPRSRRDGSRSYPGTSGTRDRVSEMATVLIIDDCEKHRAAVSSVLRDDGDFELILEASDGINGLQQLMADCVDIVICDLEMPGFDGEKLLQIKQSQPSTRDIPILFATGTMNADRRLRLLKGGAQDVITKPFHPRELLARMRLHLKVKQMREELVRQNEELKKLSTTDELTGMWNRRYLDEALAIELERARRYGTPLSLLMLDLDKFKCINDDYGHPAGDVVLAETGRRIRKLTRGTDISARYGGEEFVSVLSQNGVEGSILAASCWRSRIGDEPFELPDGRKVRVTASIGVATHDSSIKSATELISLADTALYGAKQNGRNCVIHANACR